MDIFHNSQKMVPKDDNQIIRVDMEQQDIGGRKDHLPTAGKSPDLSIKHVPDASSD